MIRIEHADLHVIDLETRLPFKYGIATMTGAPHVFVRLRVRIGNRVETGIAADHLPPKWFTKIPDKPVDEEIDEMLRVVEHAAEISVGATGSSVFELWRKLFAAQKEWGRAESLPPLLVNFGTSLVERGLIEAFAKAEGRPFWTIVRENSLGVRLGEINPELAGLEPADLLPPEPRGRVIARHTVGMADPISPDDIAPGERLEDRLPQALTECIDRYGLRHFKIKISGRLDLDIDRLKRIADVLAAHAEPAFAFTMDGNEHFRALDEFKQYWEQLAATTRLQPFFAHMLWIEQPFHRDVALDPEAVGGLVLWDSRPAIIIDESDAEIDSLAQALNLGYHGTSHKNCKGVIKSIVNACLLEKQRRRGTRDTFILSGEDLANIGPVALLQDLAVAAALNVATVERNGHHYFAGLSAFGQPVQRQILEAHADLFSPSEAGWPTLMISKGNIELGTVNAAPLGVGFELDVQQFTPVDAWKRQRQNGREHADST